MRHPHVSLEDDEHDRPVARGLLTSLVEGCGLKLAIGLTALVLTGCVVSPQPEPPGLDGIAYRMDSLEGAPGTVPTAEGDLTVIALFGEMGPATAAVNDDGSFGPIAFTFPGTDSWARADVRVDETRSETVDFMRDGDAAVPIVFPIDCVTVEPTLDWGEVDVGVREERVVTVTNDCLETIGIGTDFNGLRYGDRGFDEDFATPIEIPVGESAQLTVFLEASAPGLVEDVLSLDIRRGMDTDRRFVSLFALAR